MQIAPSLLAADFTCLSEEVRRVSRADMLHIDIMDGCFVPNISMGPLVVQALRPVTKLPFDVHLMLQNPLPYIDVFRAAGADILSVHVECGVSVQEMLRAILKSGAKAGLVLKPDTPAEAVFPYGDSLYQVTVMTVEPGFGGQSLLEKPLSKIAEIKKNCPHVLVEVDGGVNRETAPRCRAAGADILVAGTAVFSSKDPDAEMDFLRKA